MRLRPVIRSCDARLRAALIARATLLGIVWSLPGLWCAAHLVVHALESEHHAEHHAEHQAEHRSEDVSEHVEVAGRELRGDRITAIADDHDHGHIHPESQAALSTESTKKLDVPALLTAAVEANSSGTLSRSVDRTSIERAASGAPTVSRPRAPPIS